MKRPTIADIARAAGVSQGAVTRRVVVLPDGVRVVEAHAPVPGPGEAQLRMVVAGVCGSDTHALRGRHPHVHPPYAPGHEVVGVVTAVAPEVTSVRVGQRATVEPDLPCWTCKQCRAGRQNLCENLGFFGCGSEQGGMADSFTIDARRLHVVPDEFDDPTAALIEPLSTPVHALRLAGDVRDRAVAILGVGTIGLLTLKVARARGARRIVVTARSAKNRGRALAFGADAAVDAAAPDAPDQVRAELGESADVVFDCVAEQSTTTQALAIANKGGTVVVVGVPAGEVTVPLALVQDSQLRIQGSATYLPEDYADAMGLLRDGVVRAADFVTAIRPLSEAAAAFADAESGDHIKVLLRPN
jgi:2-desacetyl-2-hydroxyethyl bacteriochlorophyllide A dehydrogenase